MPRERLIEVAGSVNIPVVAIGGIDYDNCGELAGTGVDGIAVVSAIFAADDPGLATKELYLKTGRVFNYHRDFIFDMDGTILDSMPYWRNVSKEYAMQYVDKLPDDFDERTYVMDLDECSAYFRDELGINTDAATMRQTAVDIMTRHYSTDIPAKDGMLELIRREHEAGSCMCIFTSSDRGCVDAALNHLGIADCFNNILQYMTFHIIKRIWKATSLSLKKCILNRNIHGYMKMFFTALNLQDRVDLRYVLYMMRILRSIGTKSAHLQTK